MPVPRITRLCNGALALVTAVLAGSAATPTTGSVSGQLTILERPGGAQQDLATAVVWLQPTDGSVDDARNPVATTAQVAMRGREFSPHVAVVQRGGTVSYPNQDPYSHNVFSNTEPVTFDLGLYRRGAVRSATFTRAGVYPIYCNIHARMVSYVIAVPTRHVTTADDAGRFMLPDVPVGTYRLFVWHERAARVSQEVTVTAAGASVTVALDARGYIPGPHLNKFGMPYSSTRTDRY